MIAIKLIAQCLAGVGAAAACVSGGVYGMTKTSTNSFASPTNSSYYLVSTSKDNTNDLSIDMLTSNLPLIPLPRYPHNEIGSEKEHKEFLKKEMERLNEKNYTCKLSESERDDSCVVFDITGSNETGTIDLSTIKEFINSKETKIDKINKTESNSCFTELEFSLLRISNDKKDLIKTDGTTTIDLLSVATSGPDKDKSYGKLTVHAKFNKDKAEGKTNSFIAKLSDEATTQNIVAKTETINYKCYFKTKQEEKKPCTVIALSVPKAVTDKHNIDFKTMFIKTTQAAVTLEKEKFFLISFSEQTDYSSLDLTEDSIVFFETTNSTAGVSPATTTSTELKIEAPIFALTTPEGKIYQALIN